MNQHSKDSHESMRARSRTLFDRAMPASVLAENTRRLSHALEGDPGDLVGILLVRVSDTRIGLLSARISHVDLVPRIHGVPHRSSPLVRGICSVRGRIRPCGDLHELLQCGAAPRRVSGEMRIVMVGDDTSDIGFVVDEVLGVTRCEREEITSIPSTASPAIRSCAREMIVFNGESMPLLDADLVTAAIEEVLA